mmetsp:Transcript_34479/g.55615  ORF Transcript_34479/g.55615 Transcript_34479/m.55615 type:complete len:97 (+) Transcript_34479:816-1106(+)
MCMHLANCCALFWGETCTADIPTGGSCVPKLTARDDRGEGRAPNNPFRHSVPACTSEEECVGMSMQRAKENVEHPTILSYTLCQHIRLQKCVWVRI